MTKKTVLSELARIQKKHPKGLLLPEDVVAAARPAKSPLHTHFEWDDDKAGHQWRLMQARQLIRVKIITSGEAGTSVPAYVSLRQDRYSGGGYRDTKDVVDNAELRAALLEEALIDLQSWERRYRGLTELAPITAAAERVRRKKTDKRKTG